MWTFDMMKNIIKTAIIKNKTEIIIIFLIVPLIVLILSFLPLSIRDRLKVNLLEFNIITFYTAVFTHDSFEHFLGNITVYYLYTFFAYLINLISQKRKWFIKNYMLFFLVLPPIMYTALIFVNRFYLGNRLHLGCGLSGILSAILGLLPASFLIFLENSDIEARLNEMFLLIISASTLSISYIYKDGYLPFVIAPTVVFLLWRNRKGIEAIGQFIKELIYQDFFSSTLAVSVIILYFTGMIAIFPKTIIQEGGIVDIFTHCVGWALGIFLSFFLLRYE